MERLHLQKDKLVFIEFQAVYNMATTSEATVVFYNFRDRVKDRTSKKVEFTIKDGDGIAISLVGATIELDFRYNNNTGEIVKETEIGSGITVVDAANGRFDLDSFLLDWDIGWYWYGVVIDFVGTTGDIDENLQGKMKVLQNIPN